MPTFVTEACRREICFALLPRTALEDLTACLMEGPPPSLPTP
jgi:hypothetical protein